MGVREQIILPLIALGLVLVEYLFHKVSHPDSYDARATAVIVHRSRRLWFALFVAVQVAMRKVPWVWAGHSVHHRLG